MKSIAKQRIDSIVYERLLENIKKGVWKSGDKLPSEPELSKQLSGSISFLGVLLSVSYCAILGLALSSPIPIAIPSSFCVIPLNFRILLIFSPVLISCFSPFAANSLLEMRLHTILP